MKKIILAKRSDNKKYDVHVVNESGVVDPYFSALGIPDFSQAFETAERLINGTLRGEVEGIETVDYDEWMKEYPL